jgi:hypothetical protein
VEPAGNAYRDALSIRWFGSASCASGITELTISGAGPSQIQRINGSRNAISGRSFFQSISEGAADRVCEAWARQVTASCGENPQTEPGCEQEREFTFTPESPIPRNPAVRVGGRCENGSALPVRTYQPRVRITCDLSNF